MTNPVLPKVINCSKNRCAQLARVAMICTLSVYALSAAQAQTLTVLHAFTGASDGAAPLAGVTLDRAGNLYGSTALGGYFGFICTVGCGTVFKLTHNNGGWTLDPIYTFQGGGDGNQPEAPVVMAADGTLYSTAGGGAANAGVVFRLQPPASACKTALCPWAKTTLLEFNGRGDGGLPKGTLAFNAGGDVFGITNGGGSQNDGVVYELSPSNGGWTESVLYDSLALPYGGVIFDPAGNLYGTTSMGGANNEGTVYQLVPSGTGWTLYTLFSFDGDNGAMPEAGLIMDAAGNLYGTTSTMGGYGNGGTVFELSQQNGSWALTTLNAFASQEGGPMAPLTMDAAGNLYGTTNNGFGTVFKLTRENGDWTYSLLHSFTNGSDGGNPVSAGVALDTDGNLYGTTGGGGSGDCIGGCGVVFEITP
jgi:uncharacterized repeat protein (TIGR03803 family)